MTPRQDLEPQALLCKVFDFSLEDIQVNQDGAISAAQKGVIQRTHTANCRLAWWSYGIIFGIGLIGAFSDMIVRTQRIDLKVSLMYLGVTAFFGFLIWAFIQYTRHQMKATLEAGKANAVSGTIHLVKRIIDRKPQYFFCVDRHQYRIDRYSYFTALQESGVEGRHATLYYCEPWRGPLSVQLEHP